MEKRKRKGGDPCNMRSYSPLKVKVKTFIGI